MGKRGAKGFWTPEMDFALTDAWSSGEEISSIAQRICPDVYEGAITARARHLGLQSRFNGEHGYDPTYQGSRYKNSGARPWYVKPHDPHPWYSRGHTRTAQQQANAIQRARRHTKANLDAETFESLLEEGCTPEEIAEYFASKK